MWITHSHIRFSVSVPGFKIKELRGRLAIGITANFTNRRTAAEAQVPEISGVARIYNQKFFQDLHTEMGMERGYWKDLCTYVNTAFVNTWRFHVIRI